MIERLARLWCRHAHRKITTPVNGKYVCLRCLREYPAWVKPELVRIEFKEPHELEHLQR